MTVPIRNFPVTRKKLNIDTQLDQKINHMVSQFRQMGFKNASKTKVVRLLVDDYFHSDRSLRRKPRSKTFILE